MSCANKPVWVVKEPEESGACCSQHLGHYLELLVKVGRLNFQLFFVELPEGIAKCKFEELQSTLCAIKVTLHAEGSLGAVRKTIERTVTVESKLSVTTK